ncbi:MAG: hypothetical protein LBP75_09775 [Planctomycetota bacterium]|jgi:hypothetical protein|nr:hypothetical protein [Planctomycetota bacterium]
MSLQEFALNLRGKLLSKSATAEEIANEINGATISGKPLSGEQKSEVIEWLKNPNYHSIAKAGITITAGDNIEFFRLVKEVEKIIKK